MTYLLFALGLVILFIGGDLLIRGAVGIARTFRLPPMVIGLTVVGFGTSAPELLVSVQAALAGQPAIAIGNVLGSNIANILLIIGTAATITALSLPLRDVWRDLAIMLLATLLLWWMLADGMISRTDGMLLLAGLAGFLAQALWSGVANSGDDTALPPALPVSAATAIGGLLLLVVGAQLLVASATDIARAFGVSEAVIALTVLALGTSLPELSTSVVAALRKQTAIAVGNVIGSNIFNILSILGVTAVITPIAAEPRFAGQDMVWVVGTALALIIAAVMLRGVPRWAGAAFLMVYAVYIAMTAA